MPADTQIDQRIKEIEHYLRTDSLYGQTPADLRYLIEQVKAFAGELRFAQERGNRLSEEVENAKLVDSGKNEVIAEAIRMQWECLNMARSINAKMDALGFPKARGEL